MAAVPRELTEWRAPSAPSVLGLHANEELSVSNADYILLCRARVQRPGFESLTTFDTRPAGASHLRSLRKSEFALHSKKIDEDGACEGNRVRHSGARALAPESKELTEELPMRRLEGRPIIVVSDRCLVRELRRRVGGASRLTNVGVTLNGNSYSGQVEEPAEFFLLPHCR
jgi:hypothetical protein